MVLVAPRSAKLVETRGARFTLLFGYVFPARASSRCCCCGTRAHRTGRSGSATRSIGIGVGFAGTPASHSLTGSVPVRAGRHGVGHGRPPARPRRRDHAVDLRRAADRRLRGGGRRRDRRARRTAQINDSVQNQLTKSFAGAEDVAEQYPQYASQIIAAAKQSFLDGDDWAYTAGSIAVLLGAVLVFFCFPKKEQEEELLAGYAAEDAAPSGPAGADAARPRAVA